MFLIQFSVFSNKKPINRCFRKSLKVGSVKRVRQEALLLCKEPLFDPGAEKRKEKPGPINMPHQIIEDAFAPISLLCISV